jgi:hypothetical protein
MALQETARVAPAIAGSDPQKSSCLAADGSKNPTKSAQSQEAIKVLRREIAADALRVTVARKARREVFAGRLHAPDSTPLAFILREIEGGAHIRATLEGYSQLLADFIKAYGDGRFTSALHAIYGGCHDCI